MRKVDYEWDVEQCDSDDIVDHLFQIDYQDCLAAVRSSPPEYRSQIVLVCSIWNDGDGLIERSWAYVIDGKLPEYTQLPDADGNYVGECRKVPKRYHDEIAKAK